MVLVRNGLNSEQVLLMRPIYIENCILVLKQVVLIARVVLILSGLYSGILLYCICLHFGHQMVLIFEAAHNIYEAFIYT